MYIFEKVFIVFECLEGVLGGLMHFVRYTVEEEDIVVLLWGMIQFSYSWKCNLIKCYISGVNVIIYCVCKIEEP